jgi:hypothetical protein
MKTSECRGRQNEDAYQGGMDESAASPTANPGPLSRRVPTISLILPE